MQEYRREDLCRVVINDLSERCNEAVLYELALQFGPVRRIVWPTEQTLSGVPQRASFCFVDFMHPEDAKYAYQVISRSMIKLMDREIHISHLSAELSQREREFFAASGGHASSSSSSAVAAALGESGGRIKSISHASRGLHEVGAKVLVKNVDLNATEYDIQSFFEQYGAFAAPPRMFRNRNGKFRGVVILSYKDFSFSDRLIREMHEKVYRDRIITIEYAQLEDGSGRLHGNEQERANAVLIQEEERKYMEKIERELSLSQDRRQQQQNTSWASSTYKTGKGS